MDWSLLTQVIVGVIVAIIVIARDEGKFFKRTKNREDLHRGLTQSDNENVVSRGIRKSRGFRRKRSSAWRTRSNRPKGQIRKGKSVQYSIKGTDGQTKYIGITNNPFRRAGQHKKSGKLVPSDRLVVETRPISRSKAEKVETAKLKSFRQNNGRNPQHNKTNDGKYHPR